MNITAMATSYINPVQPSYLIMFVTSKCNARCNFCFYSENVECNTRKKSELSTDEFSNIAKKCGNVPYLLISGGEPVLRDDLVDIIGFFIENAKTQFVTVPSNGLSPERTERLFSELTAKYPKCHFRAAFSLDFHDQRHDISRGVPGCMEGVLEGATKISKLKETRNNLTLDIVSIYLHDNVMDHLKIRNWVREHITPDNHELHLLRPEWPETSVKGLETDHFLEEMIKYRKNSTSQESRFMSPFFRGLNTLYASGLRKVMKGKWLARCTAGSKFSVIDETGKVRLCECRTEILGDLRQNDYNLLQLLKKSRGYIDHINKSYCTCTWECAVSCNIVCNPKFIPQLILATAKQFLLTRKDAL